jgi:hypothetical protein
MAQGGNKRQGQKIRVYLTNRTLDDLERAKGD